MKHVHYSSSESSLPNLAHFKRHRHIGMVHLVCQVVFEVLSSFAKRMSALYAIHEAHMNYAWPLAHIKWICSIHPQSRRKFVDVFIFFISPKTGLSETAQMDLIANSLQQQRSMVEQLRREANIQRMPVSQACADIAKYVTEHEQEDCLLVGFSSQKVNPFREKSSCQII